ncbi:hypothetical protein [Acrocarpospora sp. B8E8]|uniref:hypothetical protein n=1 Tax=Acrocarpospora sp. B8E8 TaxID=3153572 RepID=UPI00325FCD3A
MLIMALVVVPVLHASAGDNGCGWIPGHPELIPLSFSDVVVYDDPPPQYSTHVPPEWVDSKAGVVPAIGEERVYRPYC